MKYFSIILVVLLLFSCKSDIEKSKEMEESPVITERDTLPFEDILPFESFYTTNDAELQKTKSIII